MLMYCDICGAKFEDDGSVDECPECLCPFANVDEFSPIKEYKSKIPDGGWVKRISTDESFMNAMVELYERDPIEYQLKIQQFKTQWQKQSKQSEQQSINKTHCPKCGGTEFTPVRKKWTFLSGFMTNKIELICNNCGAKIHR